MWVEVNVKYICVTITWPSDVYVDRRADVEDDREKCVDEAGGLLKEVVDVDDAEVEDCDEVEREENCDVEEGKVEMLARVFGIMLLDEEALVDVFIVDEEREDDDDEKLVSLVEFAADETGVRDVC